MMTAAVRGSWGFSPSNNALIAGFSPFSESESPRRLNTASLVGKQTASPADRDTHLKAAIASPSEQVNPSPVVSDVGTEFTDVDEAVQEEEARTQQIKETSISTEPASSEVHSTQESHEPLTTRLVPKRSNSSALPILTVVTDSPRQGVLNKPDEEIFEPQSVIHVPSGFGSFKPISSDSTATSKTLVKEADIEATRAGSADSTQSFKSTTTATYMTVPDSTNAEKKDAQVPQTPMPPTPLQTSFTIPRDFSMTPRAQTRQDFGSLSRPGSSLASIVEGDDNDHVSTADDTGDERDMQMNAATFFRDVEDDINALKTALSECWTLCNTLAGLSNVHRQRIFNVSGKGDMQEQAWKRCWKLSQNLYESKDEGRLSDSRLTLDLCRDFCQALFEIRVRDNETADSVLRVSFELNNHLFNTHDRSLPEAFRERTLDFYITLCHRLMKQRSSLAVETDSLLRACWSLAEMLYSLRQSSREGKKVDEELLGSSIQACWELCDLFREGWTQIRPERGTPRPVQTTFTQAYTQAKRSGFVPLDENGNPRPLPETPTTIFEDTITTVSPDEAPAPNILVLGAGALNNPDHTVEVQASPGFRVISTRNTRLVPVTTRRQWSSASSVHSQSDPHNPQSAISTETIRTPAEDPVLILLKALFVKAALNTKRGYTYTSSDPNLNSLPNFVANLPENAFGGQMWQMSLLEHYRKTIALDPGFQSLGVAGPIAEKGRVNAVEVARAVKGMINCIYGFGWLRDLYRYVFGFYVEEALKGEGRSNVSVSGQSENRTRELALSEEESRKVSEDKAPA